MPLSSEKLNDYANSIAQSPKSTSEAVCSKIADEFEDELMELEGLPPGPFRFLQRLFSDPLIYRQPGVWNFFMVLSAGRHRLTPSHFEQLAATLKENFAAYVDADLCLAACDFVARNYPHSDARKLLEELRELENQKPKGIQGIADEGLQILSNEIEREN